MTHLVAGTQIFQMDFRVSASPRFVTARIKDELVATCFERERLDIPLWQSREVSTRDAIDAFVFGFGPRR